MPLTDDSSKTLYHPTIRPFFDSASGFDQVGEKIKASGNSDRLQHPAVEYPTKSAFEPPTI